MATDDLVVGAGTFPGNPYDGHTLASQLAQTTTLLEKIGAKPTTAVVDMTYRGVETEGCALYSERHREARMWPLNAQRPSTAATLRTTPRVNGAGIATCSGRRDEFRRADS